MRCLILALFCLTLWNPRIILAQTQPASPAPAQAENVPVPVPAPTEKALRHYRTGNVLWCIRALWELAVPCLLLFTGFSARLRDFARRVAGKWYFALCLYLILLAVIAYGINWPLDYYQGFVRPHEYDLSNQTFAKWFSDSLKELAIGIVGGVLFLWIPYRMFQRSPRRWWLYGGLAMIPFYLFVMLIQPVLLDPLFNDYVPIENKALETKILALAERAGIHGSRVYEVKKSVDTKTVNAYVTGFLGTKRIVLWDTAIAKLTDRELLFVMGHEMGHFALDHVTKGILCLSALTFVALFGIHRTASVLVRRTQARLGFDQLSDFASLPLLVLLINIFSLALMPVGFAFSVSG